MVLLFMLLMAEGGVRLIEPYNPPLIVSEKKEITTMT